MLIEKYTEALTNPLLPEAFQFLKRKDIFAINYEHQQIGVCNESEGFSLYTFEKELLWEINKPIVGKALASMPMDDEIYDANIELKTLPNNKVVITFYGGQDGCMSYLLSFENEKLKVAKQLPNDVDFCCMLSEKEAVFTNFYEAELYIMSYPSLKTLKKHHFSKDWGAIAQPFKGDKILVTDMYCNRHYIFDISTLTVEDEIIFKGFEPYQDEVEEFLVSDIDELHYHNGELIASYMEVDSDRNAIYHWLIGKSTN